MRATKREVQIRLSNPDDYREVILPKRIRQNQGAALLEQKELDRCSDSSSRLSFSRYAAQIREQKAKVLSATEVRAAEETARELKGLGPFDTQKSDFEVKLSQFLNELDISTATKRKIVICIFGGKALRQDYMQFADNERMTKADLHKVSDIRFRITFGRSQKSFDELNKILTAINREPLSPLSVEEKEFIRSGATERVLRAYTLGMGAHTYHKSPNEIPLFDYLNELGISKETTRKIVQSIYGAPVFKKSYYHIALDLEMTVGSMLLISDLRYRIVFGKSQPLINELNRVLEDLGRPKIKPLTLDEKHLLIHGKTKEELEKLTHLTNPSWLYYWWGSPRYRKRN